MLKSLLRRIALRKRALAVLSALAIVATGGVVVGIASPAAAAYTDCPVGQACVWAGTSGTGIRVNMSYSWMLPTNTCHIINPGKVGGYESIWTTVGSGLSVYFYSSTSCGGANLLGHVDFGQSWSSPSGGIRAVIMI